MLDTTVAIETPEHIVFTYPVAGPLRRFFALLIDLILIYTIVLVVAAIVLVAAGSAGAVTGGTAGIEDATGLSVGIILVMMFAAQWVYFAAMEGWRGATVGKSLLGLRVVTISGRPITFGHAALRNLLRAADALPLPQTVGLLSPLALLVMLSNERFRRIGDLVAGTMVVSAGRTTMGTNIRLWPPAAAEELRSLPDFVRLSTEERAAIELFLRRRGRFGAAREEELANLVVPHLVTRTGFRLPSAARTLALLYDRAVNQGRDDAPPSSRGGTAA